ncbi:MAG: hypothetical protein N4A40_12815 [Tissierellales bacterium]|jgi:hypothetical protein|nr:hypothetical protein [Tissierellales bacterium]
MFNFNKVDSSDLERRVLDIFEDTEILSKDEAEEIIKNQKFVKGFEKLEKKLEEAEAIFDTLKGIIKEQEKLKKYISYQSINMLLDRYGDGAVAKSTLHTWGSKGEFGESITEGELFPLSYDVYKNKYFLKEEVLKYLLKTNKLKPKYDILDKLSHYTVLDYVLSDDNRLMYFCRDFAEDYDALCDCDPNVRRIFRRIKR